MKLPPLTLAIIVFLLPSFAFGNADGLSAEAIRDKVVENNSFGFNNARADVKLTLVSKRNTRRERIIRVDSLDTKEGKRTMVRFLKPADVAGTSFLSVEQQTRDDDQYLYLPSLDKSKRISGGQKNQRFMGTELTYADMESRDLKDGQVTRLPDEEYGGGQVFVLEAKPKESDKDSQYSRTKSWIHKVSYVPLKVEFFDRRGRLLKVLKVKRLEKQDGRWIARETLIQNEQSKAKTEMSISSIAFDVKLNPAMFTERALRQ